MKPLKLSFITILLTCALAVSALAGDMQTPVAPAPTATPAMFVQGEMQTPISAEDEQFITLEVTLMVLQNLLAIF